MTMQAEPADVDLLRNRELVQLAIGQHQVIFAFDKDVALSVEGHFTYTSAAEAVAWRPGQPRAAAKAVSLLGTTVLTAEQTDEADLRLTFSNGGCLIVTKSTHGFESYQVTTKDLSIVV
jgi:hypothetical protein